MQLHQLKRNTKNKKSKQVGRGGKRGKTSGRGHKGQKARAGHSIRPEIREEIKKLPKLRGRGVNSLKSRKVKPVGVNVSKLEEIFNSGDDVNPKKLAERSVLKKKGNKIPKVKILGTGDITKKVNVTECLFSKTAKEKIEKAGGSIK